MAKEYRLVKHPDYRSASYQKITTQEAGWNYLNMEARLMKNGQTWEGYTGENEFGFILLSGNYSAKTSKGNWLS